MKVTDRFPFYTNKTPNTAAATRPKIDEADVAPTWNPALLLVVVVCRVAVAAETDVVAGAVIDSVMGMVVVMLPLVRTLNDVKTLVVEMVVSAVEVVKVGADTVELVTTVVVTVTGEAVTDGVYVTRVVDPEMVSTV